eukprot:gene10284-21460_t
MLSNLRPIGPELSISCSTVISRKDSSRPSLAYVNVTFLDPKTRFEVITFQNFYVASVSVYQLSGDGTESCLLEGKQLMRKPHCENGAQLWYSISTSEFNELYVDNSPLRIYLYQPCSQWTKFELQNIKALGKSSNYSNQTISPSNISQQNIGNLLVQDLKVLLNKSRPKVINKYLGINTPHADDDTARRSTRLDQSKKKKPIDEETA